MNNPLGAQEFGKPIHPSEADCVVCTRRHVERAKPTQVPTTWGEIAAYAMGATDRRNGIEYKDCTSSPQDRAIWTWVAYLRGVMSLNDRSPIIPINTDPRLDDFSSDKRPEIQAGLEAAKKFAITNGVAPEQAMFLCKEAQLALTMKCNEFVEVVDELGKKMGFHLITCHGATIDAACITMIMRLCLEPKNPIGMGTYGGLFDKVEGFDAYFKDGRLVYLEIIRLPEYLKVLAASLQ